MFDRDNNEIQYKSTELLGTATDTKEYLTKRSGAGLLIFFIFFAIAALGAGFYIFVTKSNEIKNLEITLENSQNKAKGKAKLDSEEISNLKNKIGNANQKLTDLNLAEKSVNRELVKVRQKLKSETVKNKTLEKDLSKKSNDINRLRDSLSKEMSEHKRYSSKLKLLESRSSRTISSLRNELTESKSNLSYWKKKYREQSSKQEQAVRDILNSAGKRQARIIEIEKELIKTYEKATLYYSLIAWEENYKLRRLIPMTKLTRQPSRLSSSKANYPEAAKKAGIEGTVILKCLLSENGKFENIEILYSPDSNRSLAEAATGAVQKYVYSPAYTNGNPVKVMMVLGIEFYSQNYSN